MEEQDLFSYYIMVPVQPTDRERATSRTIIDWRGIPLATPYEFDRIEPGSEVAVARRFVEANQFFLKLVHPEKGTTIDYAIRCLFNPQENPQSVFAFLEIAPGCPEAGLTIPVWAVAEVLNRDVLRLLALEEVNRNWEIIRNIIQKKLEASPTAIHAVFGEFENWNNPDYGDPGNIHRVCLKCLTQVDSAGKCNRCNSQPATKVNFDLNQIRRELTDIIGKEFCKKYLVVPISRIADELTVGVAHPHDIVALDLLKIKTGLQIHQVPLPADQILYWIEQIFDDEDILADIGEGDQGSDSDIETEELSAAMPSTHFNPAVQAVPDGERTNTPEQAVSQPLSEAARAIGKAQNEAADIVECSVFAPPAVAVSQQFMMQVFLHLPAEAALAADLAMQFDAGSSRRGFRSLELQVLRGWNVLIELVAPGCEVDEPLQRLIWGGHAESLQFIVSVLPETATPNLFARVNITVNGIPAGYLKVLIPVIEQPSLAPNALMSKEALAFQNAFISYASKDRNQVLARVQVLETLGIRYFQDLLNLHPGDRYADKIFNEIDNCDLFLLFWSKAARESDWVRKELNRALTRQRQSSDALPEIRPVVLESPPVAEPWPEIADMHLNDRLLYYM